MYSTFSIEGPNFHLHSSEGLAFTPYIDHIKLLMRGQIFTNLFLVKEDVIGLMFIHTKKKDDN